MAYSDKVLDHYNNPRNVGSLDKESKEVGTGVVGAPECGDVMKLQIQVEGDRIVDAVLPAGLYTNITTDRLNGSLRSPWIPTGRKFISLQLVGAGQSMVRTVVDSCALNEFAGGGLEYVSFSRMPASAMIASAQPVPEPRP